MKQIISIYIEESSRLFKRFSSFLCKDDSVKLIFLPKIKTLLYPLPHKKIIL